MRYNTIPTDWKRNVINFDRWRDNAFGTYEFTARNYRHFFRFDVQPLGSAIRIFIVEQPAYVPRPADYGNTHRAHDANGRIYIDIPSGREPQTVPEALAWAVYWAEMTSDYITKGKLIS
jgi:hypothetical protein